MIPFAAVRSKLILPRGPSLYDGIAATRGTMASHGSTVAGVNSRSGQFARSAMTKLRILCPNFYGPETAPGGASTIKASVEYPAGVFTQIMFGGSATGTIPDGGMLLSDYVNITIPNGEKFWIRIFRQGGAVWEVRGVGYYDQHCMGDVFNFINSDQTMSGVVTEVGERESYHPIVIAPITIPSVVMYGDSIIAGVSDEQNADNTFLTNISGDQGIAARSIGPKFGYFNAGVNAETLATFLTNSTNRILIAQYASHVIFGYPTNDIVAGDSKATIESHMASAYALVSPKPTFQVTTVPRTTSTDSWATTGNQTVDSHDAVRVGWNTDLRNATLGPNSGIFDVAPVVENTPANSGLWVPTKTSDGIHPNASGYAAIQTSGVIDLSRIGSVPPLSDSGSAWGAVGSLLILSTTRRANDTVGFGVDNTAHSSVRGSAGHNSGLVYFEVELLGGSAIGFFIGLMDASVATGAPMDNVLGDTPMAQSYSHSSADGSALNLGTGTIFTTTNVGTAFGPLMGGFTAQCVVDFTHKFAYLGQNGTWFLGGDPTSGAAGTGHVATWTGAPTLFPGISFNHMTGYMRLRTANFIYSPPVGASAWG